MGDLQGVSMHICIAGIQGHDLLEGASQGPGGAGGCMAVPGDGDNELLTSGGFHCLGWRGLRGSTSGKRAAWGEQGI